MNAAITARGTVIDPSLTTVDINIFTNGIDTRTQGLDLAVNYSSDYGAGQCRLTLNANYNVGPPAADPASPWMKHLEQAHRLAHAAARAVGDEAEPSPHLGPAARHLERGLAAVYDAFDGRADWLTAINVDSRFWDAAILVARAGLPRPLAALQGACGELVGAEEPFPLVPLAPPSAPPLRAGTDLPPLHAVERPSLTPSFARPRFPSPKRRCPSPSCRSPPPSPRNSPAAAAVAPPGGPTSRSRRARAARPCPRRPGRSPPSPPPEPPPESFVSLPPPPLRPGPAFVRRWARECFEEVGMIPH